MEPILKDYKDLSHAICAMITYGLNLVSTVKANDDTYEQNLFYLMAFFCIFVSICLLAVLITIILSFISRPNSQDFLETLIIRRSGPDVTEEIPKALLNARPIHITIPFDNYKERQIV